MHSSQLDWESSQPSSSSVPLRRCTPPSWIGNLVSRIPDNGRWQLYQCDMIVSKVRYRRRHSR